MFDIFNVNMKQRFMLPTIWFNGVTYGSDLVAKLAKAVYSWSKKKFFF